MVTFAHGIGSSVVAEGIETRVDADLLCDLGVDAGQGWYFGRPGPAGALSASPSSAASPGPAAPPRR